MEIGQMLKEKRAEHQLTQETLSEKIFVSKKTISNWETGKTTPDLDSLIRLANLFNLSLDNLLLEGSEVVEKINKDVENKRKYRMTTIILLFLIISMLTFFSFKIFSHKNINEKNISDIELTRDSIKLDIRTSLFYDYSSYFIGGEGEILELDITQSFNLFSNGKSEKIIISLDDFPNKIEQVNILNSKGEIIKKVKR